MGLQGGGEEGEDLSVRCPGSSTGQLPVYGERCRVNSPPAAHSPREQRTATGKVRPPVFPRGNCEAQEARDTEATAVSLGAA